MKVSTWSFIVSLLCIFLGIGFVLMPVQIANIYGLTLNYSGTMIARFYGAMLLENGIVFWFLRKEPPESKLWPIFLISTQIYLCIHIFISFQAFLNKEANSRIIGIIILELFLILFSFIFLYKRKSSLK